MNITETSLCQGSPLFVETYWDDKQAVLKSYQTQQPMKFASYVWKKYDRSIRLWLEQYGRGY